MQASPNTTHTLPGHKLGTAATMTIQSPTPRTFSRSFLPSFFLLPHPFLVILGFSQNFVLSSASLVREVHHSGECIFCQQWGNQRFAATSLVMSQQRRSYRYQ